MASELGLTSVAPQWGWEALKVIGWSIQTPRPKNPKSASPEEAAAFKKARGCPRRRGGKAPGKPVEVFATDEHRIGLKPVTRRVWAPIGERPIAHGHHRFDWLYVTAFVSPATGETFWYVSNGVSKEFFEALLATFAREAEAGLSRIVPLVLDNAGWHGPANLKIPDGIRLIYCHPTPRSCSPPKLFGRLSTSRSSTSTSQPSQSSTRKSPPSVSPSPSSANKSKAEPDSIGGQMQSLRIN